LREEGASLSSVSVSGLARTERTKVGCDGRRRNEVILRVCLFFVEALSESLIDEWVRFGWGEAKRIIVFASGAENSFISSLSGLDFKFRLSFGDSRSFGCAVLDRVELCDD